MDSTPDTLDGVNCCPVCSREVPIGCIDSPGDLPCSGCGKLLWFLRKRVDGVVVLTFLPGLLSGSESEGRLEEVVAATDGLTRVVLNLSHLRFVSSLFLGMMAGLRRRLASRAASLKICGLNENSSEAFRTTGMDRLIELCDDEPAAIARFG
jgi:anti-anti-sigma factor